YTGKQVRVGYYIDGIDGSDNDSEIYEYIHEDVLTVNADMEYEPNLASWETEYNKVYTFTLEEGVQWHNGEKLTMEDWQFALEVIADEDYDGPRYNYVQEIEGADEY